MIVVRAPLRISFVGGSTDKPEFYKQRPGRTISTTIDKFVYVVVNRTPLINKVAARYAQQELVDHPDQLEHTRIKAALLDLGIDGNIEIASFATLPSKTGLGSSSAFSTALMKALHAFQGKKLSAREVADEAVRLEIDLLKEPIGPQDQYAAAFGGFNRLQFNPNGNIDVDPVCIDFKKKALLEDHTLLFFTGMMRDTSSVLGKLQSTIDQKFDTLSKMADSVDTFIEHLLAGNMKEIGLMLHEEWMNKRKLTSNTSNEAIDALYDAGLKAGAHGGKVLGAGGGGCLLFVVPPEKKRELAISLSKVAASQGMVDYQVLPLTFTQAGAEVLYNGDHFHQLS